MFSKSANQIENLKVVTQGDKFMVEGDEKGAYHRGQWYLTPSGNFTGLPKGAKLFDTEAEAMEAMK
jgi:hypothetical protein